MLKPPPLGLYVHVPWCVRKCPYCDFNSHRLEGGLPERDYIAALLNDLARDADRVTGRCVESVFIGGGTPSLLSPEAVGLLLEGVRSRIALASDAEITLEANPGTAETAKFKGFREAGVNRLSIGVQSFDDAKLTALGRIHDGRAAVEAAAMAREAGFTNFNLDLMFGLPGQTIAQAKRDVETAIAQRPTHVSYYQLTLEPNTLFHRSPPALPEADAVWDIQRAGQALLADAGYGHYEISAYARDGFRCRHNVNYWRFGDYLGVGAGAHGKVTDPASGRITRLWKTRHPARYLETQGLGGEHVVDDASLPFEFLMNQLRLREGFELASFTERTGLTACALEPALSECLQEGLLERHGGVIRCSDRGWNFLDEVLQRFLPPA
ncbi:radical SAM family heme chaperone HemW [Methylococcus capsulatus]|uniref:radical SAM family heme chaperone HemW n=1 Tax=Methylococcus capsulatus TaxID=414 RepID=UPI001C52FBE8|nr:radical SAM family heme chaperone HemW [Methylococcus capsulatus]QXP86519.1 radical SAM family heme chaperone HemW [Methylococcus capsulatus]QXP89262.1 radical SAM family heme chaperone HemW [Methylococcus capsulatus]QXP93811.1 radical SAM family heme chaperone HemW [Methylococcus capsulatus]UQN11467.1 radical SAM family heme chaperone HemW [Methylococcus capsulatus]